MNNYTLRQSIRSAARRIGFDLVRFPTPRNLTGHTQILLDELHIDHVLDVGGNTGQYGRFLRKLGYTGWITSFEPVRAIHDQLTRSSGADPRWHTFNVALGNEDSQAIINVTSSNDFSSLRKPVASERTTVERREQVEVRRLDSMLGDVMAGKCGDSVFLKMDTQGWDLEVLKGSAGCLDRVRAVQTEISVIPWYDDAPTWMESLSMLESLGFEPTGLFPVHYFGGFRSMEFDLVAAARHNERDFAVGAALRVGRDMARVGG